MAAEADYFMSFLVIRALADTIRNDMLVLFAVLIKNIQSKEIHCVYEVIAGEPAVLFNIFLVQSYKFVD